MKCEKCGFENEEGSRFCGKCGAQLIKKVTVTCPNCHREVGKDAIFCGYCGYDFEKRAIPQKEVKPSFIDKVKKFGLKKVAIIVVVCALLITGGYFGIHMIIKNNKYNENIELGNQYYAQEEYHEAAIAYSIASHIKPKAEEPYNKIYECYNSNSEYAKAYKILEIGKENASTTDTIETNQEELEDKVGTSIDSTDISLPEYENTTSQTLDTDEIEELAASSTDSFGLLNEKIVAYKNNIYYAEGNTIYVADSNFDSQEAFVVIDDLDAEFDDYIKNLWIIDNTFYVYVQYGDGIMIYTIDYNTGEYEELTSGPNDITIFDVYIYNDKIYYYGRDCQNDDTIKKIEYSDLEANDFEVVYTYSVDDNVTSDENFYDSCFYYSIVEEYVSSKVYEFSLDTYESTLLIDDYEGAENECFPVAKIGSRMYLYLYTGRGYEHTSFYDLNEKEYHSLAFESKINIKDNLIYYSCSDISLSQREIYTTDLNGENKIVLTSGYSEDYIDYINIINDKLICCHYGWDYEDYPFTIINL